MKSLFVVLFLTFYFSARLTAAFILLPMDEQQKQALKAYGITYWVVAQHTEAHWLLNYRGGSFAFPHQAAYEKECKLRGVSYEILSDDAFGAIQRLIASPEVNMDDLKLQVAPKIAVYTPGKNEHGKNVEPWDDAVTLALTYAEIPYKTVYDKEIVEGQLIQYDWIHLHHEDFTGQYGKSYSGANGMDWYKDNKNRQENIAHSLGFKKVSQCKLEVCKKIREFVVGGGFMFAMCSATDTYDIALAAEGVDICAQMYDGDPMDANAQSKLDFSKTFAFQNFTINMDPLQYSFSNIDVVRRPVSQDRDYFTLFDFSAKWDPIPTMLTQCQTRTVKGFMGQTTAFTRNMVKPEILVLAENKALNEARYIHGALGNGFFTFYGGHDPEDYEHFINDPETDLSLHPNSPGYRLILNNILFPAAKKKKKKT